MLTEDESSRDGRKRKHEDASPQPNKIAKTSDRDTPGSQPSDVDPEDPPRIISKEALAMVKDQLIQITTKNQGMKATMQSMRETVVRELMLIMKTRRIVLEQLGRPDLEEGMRQPCRDLLAKRKLNMVTKEDELIRLEKLLGDHEAVLEHADSACVELEEKIMAIEKAQWSPTFTSKDFPQMAALARLTGGGNYQNPTPAIIQPPPETGPSFTLFSKFPLEIRLQIWEACLPGPRIITHDSKHNKSLSLLAACRESRDVIKAKYSRVLSPGPYFPLAATSFSYVNPNIDTVVRDLTFQHGSLFDLDGSAFNLSCFVLFSGLAKVKNLALAFDLLHENGGELFGPLQACCPSLQTLILFPSSQLRGSTRHGPRLSGCDDLRFIDIDSNLVDFVRLRWDCCHDRLLKRKALRGLATLTALNGTAQQYSNVFPQYIEQFGQAWNPSIRVCLLTSWNAHAQGWQTGYLEMDRYSKGFPGEDGNLYRGFIESGIVCDAKGELLSRYDGMERLFREHI